MWFNHQAFFTAFEERFTPLSLPQRAGLDQLLGYVQLDPNITDMRWVAYMFATIKHECADAWHPIAEWGTEAYFAKYDPGTPLGASLGNLQAGDGSRYRGRGYVQITGRSNYLRLGQRLQLGQGLVDEPTRALEPLTAYRILSLGMREGLFTGRALRNFIHDGTTDYAGARRIINGQDQAASIAAYALGIEQALFIARDGQ